MRTVLLVLGLASATLAAKFNKLEWKDCNPDPNRAIKINSISISPGVVKVPGDLYASVDVDVTRKLENAELDIKIYKHLRIFSPLKIPCISNWGSCQYDPCELVKRWETKGCPAELSAHNITCACPFPPSNAKMVKQLFKVPDLPWYLDWLAKGDYNMRGILRDKTTGEELGCLEASLSVNS